MKKTILISVMALTSFSNLISVWNPFSKSSWEDLGDKIKDVGSDIKDKVIDPTREGLETAGDKIKDVAGQAKEGITQAVNTLTTGWWTITIKNSTNALLHGDSDKNKADVLVHTTLVTCSDFWISTNLLPGQQYSEKQKAAACVGACYDWFKVKGNKYYIPNHCSNSTIDVREDGIYLNGSKAHPYNCDNVVQWGIELAAKKIAMETALISLKAAEGFLDQVGKPVASTGALSVRETAKGVLVAGKEVATGVLSSSEAVAEFLLTAIDIQKRHWDGNLQDFAQGNLGNVQISGKVFNQDFDFKVTLDVRKPYEGLKTVAGKIADLFIQLSNQMNNLKVGYQPFKLSDDMIKLTMTRFVRKHSFINLT